MVYSRKTSNYLERITLSNPTQMMSIDDPVAISMEILRINSECSLKKEFSELIRMNPLMVIIPNCQSCHNCVCGYFTWDTKGILWTDYHVLIELQFPSHGISKLHILDATWSSVRWLCDQDGIICPQYLRRLTQGMRCDEILGQGNRNIREGVLDDFLHGSLLTWVTD